jgi:hypothetical protein
LIPPAGPSSRSSRYFAERFQTVVRSLHRRRVPIPGDALAEITIAAPHFKTLPTDCLGQFRKADVGQLFASAEDQILSRLAKSIVEH